MKRREREAGFTLLEVMVAGAIMSGLMVVVMVMLGRASDVAATDLIQTHAEDNIQNVVDELVRDLKETSPSLVTFYQYTWQIDPADPGRVEPQTAACFPSARRMSDHGFVFQDGGGEVQSEPVWQCLRVYCYVDDPNEFGGSIIRYEDYSARSYAGAVSVTSIDSTRIRLSDGTNINLAKGAQGFNQRRVVISGRFSQLLLQGPEPIRLTVQTEYQQQSAKLRGSRTAVTLINEVLSRNRN